MNRTQWRGSLWLVLLTLLTLAGCAGLAPLEKPKISVADIEVRKITPLETTFLVQLRVMNPNDRSLEVEGLRCDLELDGRTFASGLQDGQGLTVPGYGSALVPVELYASVVDMLGSVLNVLGRTGGSGDGGPVEYRLTGSVKVKSGGLSHTLPFESDGNIRIGGATSRP